MERQHLVILMMSTHWGSAVSSTGCLPVGSLNLRAHSRSIDCWVFCMVSMEQQFVKRIDHTQTNHYHCWSFLFEVGLILATACYRAFTVLVSCTFWRTGGCGCFDLKEFSMMLAVSEPRNTPTNNPAIFPAVHLCDIINNKQGNSHQAI